MSGKVSPDIQDGQEPENLAFLTNTQPKGEKQQSQFPERQDVIIYRERHFPGCVVTH